VRIYWWLGEVLFWLTRFDEGIERATEGLALLENETAPAEEALMHHNLAIAYRGKGNRPRARVEMRRSIEIVQSLPYVEEFRPIYVNALDLVYLIERKVDEAEKCLSAFEQQARAHHDLRGLGEAWNWTGSFRYTQGALEPAIVECERARELFALIGDGRLAAWVLFGLSAAYLSLGELERATECTRSWLEWAETLGSPTHRALALGLTGVLALCQGRAAEAVPSLQEAVDMAAKRQALAYEGLFARHLTRAYLAIGERRRALKQLLTPSILQDPLGFEPALVKVLSMMERAIEAPEDWEGLCAWVQEHAMPRQAARYTPFVCWQLEPVQAAVRPVRGPPPAFAQPEWTWVDPAGDCSYRVDAGLEIRAANGRDLWYVNWSAPRLLRQVSGDFGVQAVCVSARADRPAIGGLLLWGDEKSYLRLDRGVAGSHEIAFTGCVNNQDVIVGRGRLGRSSDRIVLRLERVGVEVRAFCRGEGGFWYTVGHVAFPVADPIHVGPHAIGLIDRTIYPGAYPDGTAIRFESIHIWSL
jgi:tetratricopeptide (TPR) repeat protein